MIATLRHAAASYVRVPRLFVTVTLIMAVSIGGLGALGNLVYAVALRPLPVPEPSRLAAFYPGIGEGVIGIAPATLAELNRQQQVFESLCGVERGAFNVEIGGVAARRAWEGVGGSCASTLGLRPTIGRLIGEDDARSADAPAAVVVLSHRFWQRSFHGDPAVLGSALTVQGTPLTIVGVGPPGFNGINVDAGADLFVPFGSSRLLGPAFRPLALWSVGRLRDGVTIEQATASMKIVWPAAYASTTTATPAQTMARVGSADVVRVVTLGRGLSELRTRYERPLMVLMLLAATLWLLASLNIGGVFLTRTVARELEFRVQMALGAGRRRLMASLAAESIMVAVVGGVLAVLLARWMSAFLLRAVWTSSIPSTLDVTPDRVAIGLMIAACALTVAVVSLPSIMLVAFRDWQMGLSSARATSRVTAHWRRGIVSAQVMASVVLLFVAGVMVQNLGSLRAIDPGFDRDRIVFARLDPKPAAAAPADLAAYLRNLLERATSIAGVEQAAVALAFPTAEVRHVEALRPAYRAETAEAGSEVTAATDWVSPGFFSAAGMSLTTGREFTWQDVAGRPDVAVMTARMAQLVFAGQEPIDRRVRLPTGKLVTVVGVVADSTSGDPRIAGFPRLYQPLLQDPRRMAGGSLILRQAGTANIRADVAAAVGALGWQSITFLRSANEQTDLLLAREQLLAGLSSSFAVLAVIVVTLGLFGLLSYAVAQRRREIGVRSALGATPARIVRLIGSEAVLLTMIGVAAGVPLAIWARSLVGALLFQQPSLDPVAATVAFGIVSLAAMGAALVPALTAARLSPAEALRNE